MRTEIESIDAEILRLVSRRLALAHPIAECKRTEGMAIYQPERERVLLEKHAARGSELGLDPGFVKRLYSIIIEEMRGKQ
ncbi:MAG: chorismate mutase [Nanobdellota archaeon]